MCVPLNCDLWPEHCSVSNTIYGEWQSSSVLIYIRLEEWQSACGCLQGLGPVARAPHLKYYTSIFVLCAAHEVRIHHILRYLWFSAQYFYLSLYESYSTSIFGDPSILVAQGPKWSWNSGCNLLFRLDELPWLKLSNADFWCEHCSLEDTTRMEE